MQDLIHLSPAAERIADVAENLIQQQGFNGFSYEDIARLVGIRKPSIHYHFASKAELANVVARRYIFRFELELLRLSDQYLKPRERIVAYANLFQATYQTNRRLCLCGMLGAESETLPQSLREPLREFFALNDRWLTGTLSEAFPLHCRPDVQRLALLLLSALEGCMIVGRSAVLDDAPIQVTEGFLAVILPS